MRTAGDRRRLLPWLGGALATAALILGLPISAAEAATATVVGTVVDESGSPVPGAWVRTSGEAGSSTQNTNSSGQFSIPAPSGNTRLAVIYPLPGDDMFVESGFFAANGITDLGTLAQPATSLLTVQVKDAAGDLVTGARVTSQGQYFTRSGGSFGNITLGGVYASFEGTTNSIGESTVRLPQGVVSSMNLPAIVTFDDPATGIEYVSAIPTFQLTQDTTKNVVLNPPATVVGTVVDESGSPVPGAWVRTSGEAGSSTQNTNSSGQFSIPAPSGNTRLAVIYPLPGDDMFVESGFFAANGITDLGTLAQPATSLLTVQVKDAAGDLVTGARVTSRASTSLGAADRSATSPLAVSTRASRAPRTPSGSRPSGCRREWCRR